MKEFKKCNISSLLIVEKSGKDGSVKIMKSFGKKVIRLFEEQNITNYPVCIFLEDGKELLSGIKIFKEDKDCPEKTCYLASSKIRDASFSDLQDNYGDYDEEKLREIRAILLELYKSEVIDNPNNEKEIKNIISKEEMGRILYNKIIRIRNK